MLYYLKESIEPTEIGCYPQIQGFDLNDFGQPKSFDVNFVGTFDPPIILPRYKMESKAKITDLISSSPLSLAFLKVSNRFYRAIENIALPTVQFFNYEFIHKNTVHSNYKALYFVKDNVYKNYINWGKSQFFITKDYHRVIVEELKFHNWENMIDFEQSLDRNNFGFLSKIFVNYQFDFEIFNFRDYHFPAGFFCTEKVVKLVEEYGFTGFRFEPVEEGIFI